MKANANNLWQKINDDLKQAMRSKSVLELSVLRMLVSAIGYKKIALNKGTDPDPLGDAEIVDIIASEIKKRKDSILSYVTGKRQDLADKEQSEIPILAKYLPVQLDEAAIEIMVKEIIAGLGEVGPKDFGRVMGQVMAKLKGRAEGEQVTEIVKKALGGQR